MFPAFPGAEGAGAYTLGGRGGQVLLVTTLADYRPGKEQPIVGSLRAAVVTKGPRTVLFRVAGNIALKEPLRLAEPYLTIAGQTAPGEGVCLTDSYIAIQAHDVVLRYLRVRPGDVLKVELDCISSRAADVIIDHCSTSWGIDETISTNGDSRNVTVQWCLLTESLGNSVHHKGNHGYGSLISGPGEISYHHNVYAYHRSRNPRPGDVTLDFRNNLIFGWGDRAGYNSDDRTRMNYVGNYLWPLTYSKRPESAFNPGSLASRLFLEGNVHHDDAASTRDNWRLIHPPEGADAGQSQVMRVNHAFATATVTTEPAEQALEHVLQMGGASLPARDAVDQRVIAQIRAGQGKPIDSQAEVGGWPQLAQAEPPSDSDLDGMPDAWERKFGLDPANARDNVADLDHDGYTNLEEYCNGTDPRSKEPWIDPPRIESEHGPAFVGSSRITMASDTPGVSIHYTLDDALPTPSSARYREPIVVDKSATLRAIAFLGNQPSFVSNTVLEVLAPHAATVLASTLPGLDFEYYEKEGLRAFDELAGEKPVKRGSIETPTLDLGPREGGFGVRLEGFFDAKIEGIYTFYLRCSPRGQFTVDGQLVVENQGQRREHAGNIGLAAGLHPIKFEIYFRSAVDKILELDYSGPGIARQPIPQTVLRRAAEGR